MRVPKNDIFSKVALYYANLNWMPHFAWIGALIDLYLRNNFSSKREIFLDVPVYFIESKNDLSLASSLLEGSADLLGRKAPFWKKQVKNVYGSVMIHGLGPMFRSDRRGRCFVINPSKFTSRGERAIVILTMNLIAALCTGLLLQGRFGYFGIKHSNEITYMAVARFLRKCNSNGEFSNRISWCYQQIDKVRSERYYYERFRSEESLNGRPEIRSEKW